MATSTDVTLRTARLTAAFCSIVAALYVAVAIEPAPVLVLFISWGPLTTVCVWLQKESRRTGIGNIQDWGFFLWLFWPVLIPWYAFKTRGISGWRLAAALLGLACAPFITTYAIGLLLYGLGLVRDGTG
jgi:hypothetical protein